MTEIVVQNRIGICKSSVANDNVSGGATYIRALVAIIEKYVVAAMSAAIVGIGSFALLLRCQ